MKKGFHNLVQHYRDMKLQSKFTMALALAVTVPVLMMGIFFYGRLYNMIVSDTIRQEQDASSVTAPRITEIVEEVLAVSQQVSDQPFYQTLFDSTITQPVDSLMEASDVSGFCDSVSRLIDGELITDIRIYLDTDRSPLFDNPDTAKVFYPVSPVKGTYWYGIFHSGIGIYRLHCPSFYLGPQERRECGNMSYVRSVSLKSQTSVTQAYLVVYYSEQKFEEILSEGLTLEGSVSYIMNDRNALVASTDDSKLGIYWLSYDVIQDSFMSSNNFIERTILDNKIYAGFYSIAQTDWFMVTILPSQPLIKQSNHIMTQFILLYAAFLILALLVANVLSRSITNRISSVILQMRKVRQGPPVAMESPVAHDEIGDLIDTYNYMTRRMNTLMEEQSRAAEDLRIAEFNSLQAQINPHFLYNTMDMINWLALQGRTSEVSTAVQMLSRFYKLTLNRKESISTVAKETEHVSIYIRLQNMRFHDQIQFISDIPDELSEYQIPRLTLQPVIENAILHGILEKESKSGTIVLTGWMEEQDIVLLISYDGVGIAPEKMATILSGTGQSTSGGTNIAVFNTHRRLQILYGEPYGLSYSSTLHQGTEVQIRIPAHRAGS